MAELSSASVQGKNDGPSATQTRAVRREWSNRGALVFWIVASGVVWAALAVSAIWIY